MYQVHQQYHQGLGTAGHRAAASFSYLPPQQYNNSSTTTTTTSNSTTSGYFHHRPSQSMYQQPYAYQQQPQHMTRFTPVINHHHHHQQQPPQAQIEPVEQEPAVNGGINSVLEYDLNTMSTFLSWCSFGMLKQSRNPTKEFESLIVSVLFATRLPKSTIVIALEYMNQRFSAAKLGLLNEHEIFNHLIVSLVLANKFNDDNTFTNKSWCGATGLDLKVLNKLEKDWLEDVKWSLNVVNFESNILTLEECWKTWLDKYGNSSSCTPISTRATTTPIVSNNIPSSPIKYAGNSSSPVQTYRSSIPSSPIYYSHEQSTSSYYNYPHSSPIITSPIKYDHRHDNIWSSQAPQPPQPVWNNYNSQFNDPAVQYVGAPIAHVPMSHIQSQQYPPSMIGFPGGNGFVGYANPYYMATC
ncbi:CLG1 [[Candida] subhashii]|uniref:CLG1 n=1 Tax=[Candida] subhashii TaxID=561895 RepID=A0A8J5UWH7_9ASCO|nr:CLG1 [[Candida] subhashii]KAG7662960.1 CLG1 [[Candida] subhashii]